MKLIKVSAPGWEKDFNSEQELKEELFAHICSTCRSGFECPEYSEDPVTINSELGDLLYTACGCEFMVEK